MTTLLPSFGTSGLRGPAVVFTPSIVSSFVASFLELVAGPGEKFVLIGADLRDSSPPIAGFCMGAVRAIGWEPIYAGNVPTPALAAYALEKRLPAIMVTGSHIPATHNGLKFYRRDGEFLKEDEAPVRNLAALKPEIVASQFDTKLGTADPKIAESYFQRYTNVWHSRSLTGLKIGIDMHSAVGRDLLVRILEALGAQCFPFRRLDSFIAVDTEALETDDLRLAFSEIKNHGLDAVVSTDGDGDRPLVIDADGVQINGDVLCALAAQVLRADTVVTPLTSTTAIEHSGWFKKIVRTRIGSPYVVTAMRDAEGNDNCVVGFEANGGLLLQTPIMLSGRELTALPTRDAILPIIAVLLQSRKKSVSLSALTKTLPPRIMKADRVTNVNPSIGRLLLDAIRKSVDLRGKIHGALTDPVHVDTLDGVRMQFSDGSFVHFRQSGNAPEMRCYVETRTLEHSVTLLSEIMAGLKRELQRQKVVHEQE